MQKKTHIFMCVFINRQFPILPGRLQPSTFGLYVLNYCVRNGNRWNHVGNITGFVERLLFQNYTEESCFEHFSQIEILANHIWFAC